jgi:3-oxoadipate enol-lactonase
MPSIAVNGVDLNYYETGSREHETIVFTHSLLWDNEMFSDLVADLASDFHIVNIDQHGHGRSSFRQPLTLTAMAEDYALLLDKLALTQVHWAGLSMGGMVGMRLAIAHPEKIRSLILMDTSARAEREELRETGEALIEIVRSGQAASVVDAVLPFFFAPITFKDQPQLIARYQDKLSGYRESEGIYQATQAVFQRDDITDRLREIKSPALVIVGAEDVSTTPEQSEHIVAHMANARLAIIADAGHMSATEQPQAVATEMRNFLNTIRGGA